MQLEKHSKTRIAFFAMFALSIIAFGSFRAYRTVQSRNVLIESLQQQVSALSDSSGAQEGGLETNMPITKSQEGWVFPILADDYVALTSPFGYRTSPVLNIERYHQGVDVAAAWRAQVVAAADGVVVEHWPAPDEYFRGHRVYGGFVIIEHAEGWRTYYAHLSSTRVSTGDRVVGGDVIGRVGGTGMSRGEHLHFEIRDASGEAKNPLLYVVPAVK